MKKPKTPQKENLHKIDGRDLFQTPNYAVDILVPFIPKLTIWECAAGQRKIVNRLSHFSLDVFGTDLQDKLSVNFLFDVSPQSFECIITNPPFSLKRKFYLKCKEYNVPFALLIPADYSGWIIKAIQEDGAEKIIPTRRIDYITPNLRSKSQSQFHSMWLTWGFNLGRTETFVELTNEMKANI